MVNKLLRVINSSYYSLPTTIKSISQAIAMLGTRQLQAWMTLMLMGKIEKPPELTTIGLQRAKMCEGFARAKGLPHVDTHFLVGLLSILDALMDTTMEELISNIPVSKEVVDALLTHRGDFGQMLQIVMAYERGDWGSVSNLKLSSETIRRVYLDAIDASSRTSKEMHFATATAY
jgi:EAL and modified HD-GYP domain-containing signal transduction protein